MLITIEYLPLNTCSSSMPFIVQIYSHLVLRNHERWAYMGSPNGSKQCILSINYVWIPNFWNEIKLFFNFIFHTFLEYRHVSDAILQIKRILWNNSIAFKVAFYWLLAMDKNDICEVFEIWSCHLIRKVCVSTL